MTAMTTACGSPSKSTIRPSVASSALSSSPGASISAWAASGADSPKTVARKGMRRTIEKASSTA